MGEDRRIVTPSPENSETPLEAVRSWVTPTRLFFVRNHFDVPAVDPGQWRLSVSGAVARPMEITWDELNSMPQRTLLATLECAGNGRSFLTPRVAGVQWGAGAVGHAEWSGVPLRMILEQAGIDADASEVVCEGADCGTEPDHPERMHFARSLPRAKALHRDTLLALRMNGEPLDPLHGFPVRLLVPGWYGVASVKWLTRIEVSRVPFRGYFQAVKYTIRSASAQATQGVQELPVQEMAVKSEILRPIPGETVRPGDPRIFGVAWAGEETVAGVEVSTDGGKSWSSAELLGPFAPYSWTLWEFPWEVAVPGAYQLVSRAKTAGGRCQPAAHDPLLGGYMIHFHRPLTVQVGVTPTAEAIYGDSSDLLLAMHSFAERNAGLPLDVDLDFIHGAGI